MKLYILFCYANL